MNIHILTDEPIAKMWIKHAEETGDDEACFNVGLLYLSGLGGVEIDIDKAIYWFNKATIQVDVEAMNNLGVLFGQRRDFLLAAEWFQRAADNGDEMAQRNLEKCLEMLEKDWGATAAKLTR